MTDSNKFWERVNRDIAAAHATPLGERLCGQNFQASHNGGGTLAWKKENDAGDIALITWGDMELGLDVANPDAADWFAGIYSRDGGEHSACVPVTGLDAAVAWCDRALESPFNYLPGMANRDCCRAMSALAFLEPAARVNWHVAANAATAALASMLADRFAAVLREWLSPSQFAEMVRRNRTPDYAHGSCASHDFCDANMAMLEAWTEIVGADCIDADREPEARLWNAAWNIARARHIGCAPVQSTAAGRE